MKSLVIGRIWSGENRELLKGFRKKVTLIHNQYFFYFKNFQALILWDFLLHKIYTT